MTEDFDIIPRESRENRSPVVCIGHNVALESWCIPYVYSHAHHMMLGFKKSKLTIDEIEGLKLWSSMAVLLNPDFHSAWNQRKDLIMAGHLSPFSDLQISQLSLSRKPKSAETFSHRRWLLTRVIHQDCTTMERLLRQELELCGKYAQREANNIHAWSHRIWSVQHLDPNIPISLLCCELASVRQWVAMHVSDHSAMHYMEHLLTALQQRSEQESHDTAINLRQVLRSPHGDHIQLSSANIFIELLVEELQSNEELIRTYPCHEALWNHRRYFLFHLLHGTKEREPVNTGALLKHEMELSAGMQESDLRHSNAHRRWCQRFL
ncbi:unnamed protein product [Darwinula stevensoni]|uniref:Protein prenyltransferase alpha subunit repeat-containing protein 1 n=1 Tax=Darwinula stevensoni TaxID=69355 RepID=A0A7R8XAS6_9CRUS|nr:unnamed protein product [Darwinula stevensoni]CAG0887028.1 unnamed protein product [Darwinula stevensoni]